MKRRKDSNGRVLKEGESQRKDGIYQYRWTDKFGKRNTIYDKDLKKLREKEQELNKRILNGFCSLDNKTTVYQLVQKLYDLKKPSIKIGTRENYEYVLKKLSETPFGELKIIDVKCSDAKKWIIELEQSGLQYKTILSIAGPVKLAFKMACEDDLIYKSPMNFKISSLIKSNKRDKLPLTEKQYSELLEFILLDRTFRKYYEEIVFLHETGIRISEFCGLTIKDFDFTNKEFTVNRQLVKNKHGQYRIETPKSKAGYRTIPLSDEAYRAIRTIINRRPKRSEVMIDGCCGFINVKSNGMPRTSWNTEYALRQIVKEHNRVIVDNPLPHITPHTFRHTFCTEKIKSGMNIKAVQYLMGHSDIETTLNIYTTINYEDVKTEFSKVESL